MVMARETLKLVATDCVLLRIMGVFKFPLFDIKVGTLVFTLRSLLKMTMYNQVSIDFR